MTLFKYVCDCCLFLMGAQILLLILKIETRELYPWILWWYVFIPLYVWVVVVVVFVLQKNLKKRPRLSESTYVSLCEEYSYDFDATCTLLDQTAPYNWSHAIENKNLNTEPPVVSESCDWKLVISQANGAKTP